jgi:flagellin
MINGISNSTFPLQTRLQKNLREQSEILYRLATGRRINSGKDDPAGLIAATQLEGAITALDAESRAIERADANANIVDAHARQLSMMTGELRALTIASANTGALSDAELAANQLQVDNLTASVQRFAQETISSLEGIKLPEGGNQQLAEQLRDAANSVATLASGGANDLSSGNFEAIETVVKDATATFAEALGTIGTYQKYTLEARQNSLEVERENLAAAHSRIVDVVAGAGSGRCGV